MSSPWQPRVLEPRDLPAALAAWGQAHPEGATCAGDALLTSSGPSASSEAHVVCHEGEPIALGLARCWGRVGQVHGLIVAEPFRRRGVGAALLGSLLEALERRDAAVIGVEVDSGGAAALTFLSRAGFRPMHLSFVLERAVAAQPTETEADAGAEADAGSDSTHGATNADVMPGLTLLAGSEGVGGLAAIRMLSTAVDADFDPTAWLETRLLASETEVALLSGDAGEPVGFAVLPRIEDGTLLVSMAIATDGPPHAGLHRMMTALEGLARTRGCSRVQVAAPSRYWDATLALLEMGYRPRTSFLRLTRQGTPERADTRRCALTSWR